MKHAVHGHVHNYITEQSNKVTDHSPLDCQESTTFRYSCFQYRSSNHQIQSRPPKTGTKVSLTGGIDYHHLQIERSYLNSFQEKANINVLLNQELHCHTCILHANVMEHSVCVLQTCQPLNRLERNISNM